MRDPWRPPRRSSGGSRKPRWPSPAPLPGGRATATAPPAGHTPRALPMPSLVDGDEVPATHPRRRVPTPRPRRRCPRWVLACEPDGGIPALWPNGGALPHASAPTPDGIHAPTTPVLPPAGGTPASDASASHAPSMRCHGEPRS